jgi:hypothetical protein
MDREFNEKRLTQTALKCGVPDYMVEAFVKYILTGHPMGSFATSVVQNDLMDAVSRADPTNAGKLRETMLWFYNYTPSPCWGSVQNYKRWRAQGGMENRPVYDDVADEPS